MWCVCEKGEGCETNDEKREFQTRSQPLLVACAELRLFAHIHTSIPSVELSAMSGWIASELLLLARISKGLLDHVRQMFGGDDLGGIVALAPKNKAQLTVRECC